MSRVPSRLAFGLACGVVLLTPAAYAQPAGSAATSTAASLSLDDALARATAVNPTLVAARTRRAINEATVAVAAERPNPDVALELTRETPREALGFSLPIELGGKRDRRIAVGQASALVADADIAALTVQVRNDVRRTYFGVLVSEARLRLLGELRELATRARDTARTRFERGDVPRLELLQAELALAAATNEVSATTGLARAARTQLNALIGQPLDAVVPLTTSLDDGPQVATAAAVERARTASAELTVLDRQLDEQRARVALARALRVPDVTPSATVTHGAEPDFSYGWRAGAALTVPLFATHKAGVVLEERTLDGLAAQREATLARLTGEVTAAAVAADAQRDAYVRYRDAIVPQAQEVEQLAQDAYQLGQTSIAALLQALQATRDVRLRALDALAQWQLALADLERAIGAPLP